MGITGRLLAGATTALLLFASAASAQQLNESMEPATGPVEASSAPTGAATPTGPLVYLCDSAGRLGTLNVQNKAVHVIGNLGVVLTDIAFAPNGTLYGVSFTDFYRVNKTTGKATRIGSLGVNGINALAFNKAGQAIAASVRQTGFFLINVGTGRARPGGSDGGFLSAGDLAYSGNHLFFSTTNNLLVDFNLATQSYVARPHHISVLYGLAVPAAGQLYGFAGTTLYKINTSTAVGTPLANFGGHGLGQIYGAASLKIL